jgi:hypothetical protein
MHLYDIILHKFGSSWSELGHDTSIVLSRGCTTVGNKKPNFRSYSPKKSGKQQSFTDRLANLGAPKKSKGQDSRKVHDTKGKNTQGRRSW